MSRINQNSSQTGCYLQSLFAWTLSTADIPDSVRAAVDMIWNEAVGELERNLSVSANTLSKSTVEQAEGTQSV